MAAETDNDEALPALGCCLYCGSTFPHHVGAGQPKKFCKPSCRHNFNARQGVIRRQAARCRKAECPECNRTFTTSNSLRVYCGETCRQRVLRRPMDARRRAMRKDRAHEKVDPFEVFERDGWHCHLCGKNTPRRLRGSFEDRAPELDHIVPLAAGGDHTYANTACSCRKCNREKGATPMGQPRLDFGPLPINQHA